MKKIYSSLLSLCFILAYSVAGAQVCDIVYVAPGGSTNSATCGSPSNPCATLSVAWAKNPRPTYIKIQGGTYQETSVIDLTDNVVIDGGYVVSGGQWIKSTATSTILIMSGEETVVPNHVVNRVGFVSLSKSGWTLKDITVTTTDASGFVDNKYGKSNYGIRIVNSSNYNIIRCKFNAGNGSNGNNGINGTNYSGPAAASGGNASGRWGGAGAGGGGNGGNGGRRGDCLIRVFGVCIGWDRGENGYPGGNGTVVGGSCTNSYINTSPPYSCTCGTGGAGGGGSQDICFQWTLFGFNISVSFWPPRAGRPGCNGANGTPGANGAPGSAMTHSPAGYAVPGGQGGTGGNGGNGFPGGGGGGGGGVGVYVFGTASDGGGGGGGGAGGQGSTSPGTGGWGGGGSFGIYIRGNVGNIVDSYAFSANPGRGGQGGIGGTGQPGGAGGQGYTNTNCAGPGGPGGFGGNGGKAGDGGNGSNGDKGDIVVDGNLFVGPNNYVGTITVSSWWNMANDYSHSQRYAYLHDVPGGPNWSAATSTPTNPPTEWIQLDFGSTTPKTVANVATQGRVDCCNQWVTAYRLDRSSTNTVPPNMNVTIGSYTASPTITSGADVRIFNFTPVSTRAVRLYPTAANNHISMRVAVNYNHIEAHFENMKFCKHSEFKLVKAAGSGNWVLPSGLTIINDINSSTSSYDLSSNTILVSAADANTSYTIGNQAPSYSSYINFIQTSIDDRPEHVILINGSASSPTICAGLTLHLSDNDATRNSLENAWDWLIYQGNNVNSPLWSSSAQSPSVLPSSIPLGPGVYTIRYRAREVCCGWSKPVYRTFTIVPDPTPPVIQKTAASNQASACSGASLSIDLISPGSGGAGTCQVEYQVINTNGVPSSWSTTHPGTVTAGAATGNPVIIKARRVCSSGTGCPTSSEVSVSWNICPQPQPGEVTPVDNNTTCAGQILSLPNGGGAVEVQITGASGGCNPTDVLYYRYIDNMGVHYPVYYSGGPWDPNEWYVYTGPFPVNYGDPTNGGTAMYYFATRRTDNSLGCVASSIWVGDDPVIFVENGPTIYPFDTFRYYPVDTNVCVIADPSCYDDVNYNFYFNCPDYIGFQVLSHPDYYVTAGCTDLEWNAYYISETDPPGATPAWYPGPTEDDWEYLYNTGGIYISTGNSHVQTVRVRARVSCDDTAPCEASPIVELRWNVVPQPAPPTITPLPTGNQICVSGQVSATFTVGSGGTGNIQDIYEINTGSGWTPYTPGTLVSGPFNLNGTVQIRTRRQADGLNCNDSPYNVHTWNVVGEPQPPTINASPLPGTPVCVGGTLSVTFNPGSGGGLASSCTDHYEYSYDGINWTTISNPPFNNPPLNLTGQAIGQPIRIRTRRSCAGNCVQENIYEWPVTAPVSISVNPTDKDVCPGGSKQLEVSVTGAAGAMYTYQWQMATSSCSGSFSNVGSPVNTTSTTNQYTVSNIPADRYYRVVVTQSGAGCASQATSACAVVILNEPTSPVLTASTPAVNGKLCSGETLTASFTPGGGRGASCYDQIEYRYGNGSWQSFVSPFVTSGTGTRTLEIRTRNVCDGGNCASSYNIYTWTVTDSLKINSQPQDGSLYCQNDSKTLSVGVVPAQNATVGYQWQEASSCSGTWSDINGATNSTLNVTNLTSNKAYRVKITQSGAGCDNQIISHCATIQYDPPVPPAYISVNPLPGTSVCTGTSVSISLLGGSGGGSNCVDIVEYSYDGSTWDTIISPIPINTTGTLQVRRKRTCTGNTATCSEQSTYQWTMIEDIFNIVTQPQDKQYCTGSNNDVILTVVGSGNVHAYQWMESDSDCNGTFDTIPGATDDTLIISNPTTTKYYIVLLRWQNAGNCDLEVSNCVKVEVINNSGGHVWIGAVSNDWFDPANWSSCAGGIPDQNTVVIIPKNINPSRPYPVISPSSQHPNNINNPAGLGKAVCARIEIGTVNNGYNNQNPPSITIESGAELKVNNR